MSKATIYYRDIGDYLNREEKLAIIKKFHSIANMEWTKLEPNEHGDWINLRNDSFGEFIPLAPEKKFDGKTQSFFTAYSLGIATNKDAWLYNYSSKQLELNLETMVSFYNEQRKKYHVANNNKQAKDFVEYSSNKITWTDMFLKDIENNNAFVLDKNKFCHALYRPFSKQQFCYEKQFLQRTYQQTKIFPPAKTENLVICVSGIGVTKDFSCIITDTLPDLELIGKSQCFPLYYYEENKNKQKGLFDTESKDDYIRRDAVSDFILERARKQYGKTITKEDIFYYVYGFLHSPKYRKTFAADLKKMLPRLPLIDKVRDFWAFSKAGRKLADLHLNYENAERCRDVIEIHNPLSITDALGQVGKEELEYIDYRVEQMRFPRKDQKDIIIYNSRITLENIPSEAYEYVVNGKSAVEWIMERYAMTTHKESGIKNDPNEWAMETGKPRYILDLLQSVITVSVQTVEIVKGLPEVEFE